MTDDFLDSYVSFAVVLRIPYRNLEVLKERLANDNGMKLVYQKTSIGNLYITEQRPGPEERKGMTQK